MNADAFSIDPCIDFSMFYALYKIDNCKDELDKIGAVDEITGDELLLMSKLNSFFRWTTLLYQVYVASFKIWFKSN